jgi:hypothetical protein
VQQSKEGKMKIFVLREGAYDPGTAFSKFRDAADAAAELAYGEIVKADLPQHGAQLLCALFNRELGDNARIIAVVHDGQVLMLNQTLAPQWAYACPQGHIRGVVAPPAADLRCGVCGAPLQAG